MRRIHHQSLESITIPDSVTSICDIAFASCAHLESITIPKSVTRIVNSAFYYCSSPKRITIPNSVTSIGEYAFSDTAYYNKTSNWENGVLYIGKHLIAADDDKITNNYAIKDGTLTIVPYAFVNCYSLKNVTIPDSVTSIGEYAFNWCSDDFTIYVKKGSYAEKYATENYIPFVDVNNCDHSVKTYVVGANAATCTAKGYTGDTKCTVCNKVVSKGKTIAAKGHKTTNKAPKLPPLQTVRLPLFALLVRKP